MSQACRLTTVAQVVAWVCAGAVLISPWAAWAQPTSSLQAALAELNRPVRSVPFRDVIWATTGHRVLSLETNNPAHRELVRRLQEAAARAAAQAQRQGLIAARANEAGNAMEPLVRRALREVGLQAQVPTNTAGRAQVAGYPDLEIAGPVPCYLELKTYSAGTAQSAQRTFYYSPSARPKVTHDAVHLLLGFELEASSQAGPTAFVPVGWTLLTLEDLRVDLKLEFNQSNRGLYGRPEAVLGRGRLEPGQRK